MKVKFLVNVWDKNTNKEYVRNQIEEFEDKRGKEITEAKQPNGQPYAIEITEEIVETATKEIKAETAVKKARKKKADDTKK